MPLRVEVAERIREKVQNGIYEEDLCEIDSLYRNIVFRYFYSGNKG